MLIHHDGRDPRAVVSLAPRSPAHGAPAHRLTDERRVNGNRRQGPGRGRDAIATRRRPGVDLAGRAGGESGRPPGGDNTMTSPIPGMRQALPPTRPWQREVLDAQLTQCSSAHPVQTSRQQLHPGSGRVHPGSGRGTTLAHRRWGRTAVRRPRNVHRFQANVHELAAPRPSSTGHPPPGASTPAAWSTLCCGRRAPHPGRPSPPPADPTTRHEERDPRNGGHGR